MQSKNKFALVEVTIVQISAKMEVSEILANQDRKATAFISYLSRPGSKLLSWILQCLSISIPKIKMLSGW